MSVQLLREDPHKRSSVWPLQLAPAAHTPRACALLLGRLFLLELDSHCASRSLSRRLDADIRTRPPPVAGRSPSKATATANGLSMRSHPAADRGFGSPEGSDRRSREPWSIFGCRRRFPRPTATASSSPVATASTS